MAGVGVWCALGFFGGWLVVREFAAVKKRRSLSSSSSRQLATPEI